MLDKVGNSNFLPLVQKSWPLLTFLSFPSLGIGASRYFTTLALHPEPPGGRSPPPSLARRRVPTGSPTSGHPQLGEQSGRSVKEAGQVGGGGAQRGGLLGSAGRKAFYSNVVRTGVDG